MNLYRLIKTMFLVPALTFIALPLCAAIPPQVFNIKSLWRSNPRHLIHELTVLKDGIIELESNLEQNPWVSRVWLNESKMKLRGHANRLLELGVENGSIAHISTALKFGAHVATHTVHGDNIFHIAARLKNPTIFQYLLQLPIPQIHRYLQQPNMAGELPITLIAQNPELRHILASIASMQQ